MGRPHNLDETAQDTFRRQRRSEAARRLREHRERDLGYDPSDTPSLSARRALARMFAGGRYTTQQFNDFSQSDQPGAIQKQLLVRKLVRSSGIGEYKRWSLTLAGLHRAEALRNDHFNDFLPPKEKIVFPDLPYRPRGDRVQTAGKPVLSRTAKRLFESGAPASKYLTPAQQRLLVCVAGQPDGQIREEPYVRTANALVRFHLAERTASGWFRVTESGRLAAKGLI